MGTTLTGTTPQDTYDSLIKVTDNGPLSGSLKKLTDGLGNDSSLSLSTTAASFSGNIDALGSLNGFAGATQNLLVDWSSSSQMTTLTNTELFFGTNAQRRLTISAAGNVGIGATSPDTLLTLGSIARTDSTAGIKIFRGGGTSSYATYGFSGNAVINSVGGDLVIQIESSERARFTSNGLTFNGDTAAANALDDYEEGTFTPSFAPSSGAYGTLTYDSANGKYTKIGNRVDFSLRVTISAYSAGTASGNLRVENLPFTCVSNYVGSVSMSLVDNFAANRYPIKGFVNDTTSYILLRYMTALNTNEAYVEATDITASSTIRISGTYFTA